MQEEGRPARGPPAPQHAGLPRKRVPVFWRKENIISSGPESRLANAQRDRGQRGAEGLSPPSGCPRVRVSWRDILYPAVADLEPGFGSQPWSYVGGAGFNLLISNDFRASL